MGTEQRRLNLHLRPRKHSNPPGALTGPVYEIPDWYKVGWREVTGIDNPVAMGEVRDKNILASFISEQVRDVILVPNKWTSKLKILISVLRAMVS